MGRVGKLSSITLNNLIERLAELNHINWCKFVGGLIQDKLLTESKAIEFEKRFKKYESLNGDEKVDNRVYANKVIDILKDFNLV